MADSANVEQVGGREQDLDSGQAASCADALGRLQAGGWWREVGLQVEHLLIFECLVENAVAGGRWRRFHTQAQRPQREEDGEELRMGWDQKMNALLLNREGFQMPADGWYQIAPLGEFAHAQAGVIQVLDREACEAMANQFRVDSAAPNFAGLLVDFDHFSLDGEKKSEAAGWIVALEARGQEAGVGVQGSGEGSTTKGSENTKGGEEGPASPADGASPRQRPSTAGLWAKIRWSDVGEAAVTGGRYRFLSPVWTRTGCVDLGNGRLRPVRLLNAALTNDPNLKGMCPLSNNGKGSGFGVHGEKAGQAGAEVAGKAAEASTTKDAKAEEMKNGGVVLCAVCGAECARPIANTGWTDEARAASLAVRRAKAASRAATGSGTEGKKAAAKAWADAAIASYRAKFKRDPATDAEIAMAENLAKVPAAYRTNGAPESAGKGPTPNPSPAPKRDANGFEYDERYGPQEEAAFVKKYGHTPRNTAERYEAERLGAATPAETPDAGAAKSDVVRLKAEHRKLGGKTPDSGIRVLPVLPGDRKKTPPGKRQKSNGHRFDV